MTAIERILTIGRSARSGDAAIPTDQDIHNVEALLGFRFPESYREFVRLGGLSELRINHRVLPPSEVLLSWRCLPDQRHVPFADNGCGDFYCWPHTQAAEPVVVFADHETGYTYSEAATSFTDWLEAERF